MAITYQYKAVTNTGRTIEGQYSAESKDEVVRMLRDQQQFPVSVEEHKIESMDLKDIKLFEKKVTAKDLVIFCKQFYTMLNAGLYLTKCLEVLIAQTENKKLKATVVDLHKKTQKGEVLSKSMKDHTKVFPPILINMVESAELTGNLGDVLEKMADHFEKENRINTKIKAALMYPMILSVVATLAVVFLLTFVMPTFIGMFSSSGVALPGPTRALMAISDAIKNYWYIFLIGFFVIGYITKRILSTKEGKRTFDQMKFRIPIINKSITKIITSRFTRTLSTLLSSGIPILQALEASALVTNNQVVIDEVQSGIDDIRKGVNLAAVFNSMNLFPPMMISMITIGEESGSLSDMLEKTANFYDEELDAAIGKMLSLLEPLMIVFMALIIGFIVIAMMLPMFDMFQTI